ncbi:MAG: TolC family protein [Candidatus Omnitrophota bacterium]|nr:TolC family protein [Candidatus Omnitrophota bacterium]
MWGEGKIKLDAEKSRAEVLVADLFFVKRMILKEIVKTWFLAIEAKIQLKLAKELIDSHRKILDIIRVKHKEGVVSMNYIHLAKADLARTEEVYIQVQGAYSEALRILELLLGRQPTCR